MNPISRLIIFIVIGIILASFVYFLASQADKGIAATKASMKTDSVEFSSVLPDTYATIFKKNNQLVFDKSVTSKTRSPFSQFRYANSSLITIYEMRSDNDLPLDQTISETNNHENISTNIPYNAVIDDAEYELWCKTGIEDKKSHTYINFDGNKPVIIKKSDSLVYYFDVLKTLSIKYNLKGPQDLFANIKEGKAGSISMELMFLRKKNSVYLILLFDGEKNNQHNILASLLN